MRQAGDIRKTEVMRQKGYMKQTEGVCHRRHKTGELRKIELRKTRDVRRET